MKKLRKSIRVIAVLSILLFLSAGSYADAKELAGEGKENIVTDTRPDYVIYVNSATNCVTVKQQGEGNVLTPVKSIVCSCGREGHETPEGTFHTSDYYTWRNMVDGTYGRYAVRFSRKILFHSVPYLEKAPNTLEWEEYNKLGQNASLGCVRMSVEDAKWIYDNCKPGTTVIVYSDAEEVGELGKPAAAKIDENSPFRGWDPTDIDPNNPWLTVRKENSQFVGSVDEFNYAAYADRYPDLKNAFGYDRDALYNHYITYGINERRIAEFY